MKKSKKIIMHVGIISLGVVLFIMALMLYNFFSEKHSYYQNVWTKCYAPPKQFLTDEEMFAESNPKPLNPESKQVVSEKLAYYNATTNITGALGWTGIGIIALYLLHWGIRLMCFVFSFIVIPERRLKAKAFFHRITTKEFLVRAVLLLLVIYITLLIVSNIKHNYFEKKRSERRSGATV